MEEDWSLLLVLMSFVVSPLDLPYTCRIHNTHLQANG